MPDKRKIRNMFDGISADYDRLNHLLSLGIDRSWRRRALREIIDPAGAQHILDVACGTGDFSIAIARKMHADSHVTGLDLSPGMLAVMQEKVKKAGLQERISTLEGDCEHLGWDGPCFDRVTIAFGIRNFENRAAALREILRVLKPGGKLVILELSVPSNPLLRSLYKLYFTRILPRIGGAVSGDRKAYEYLPASVLGFPGPKEWTAFMQACGYTDVRHRAFTLGICRMYIGKKAA